MLKLSLVESLPRLILIVDEVAVTATVMLLLAEIVREILLAPRTLASRLASTVRTRYVAGTYFSENWDLMLPSSFVFII